MNFFYSLNNIYWREPLWFLLMLQPLILLFLRNIIAKNNLSLYAEKKLQPWVVFPNTLLLNKLVISKNVAYILAWLLFSASLAGPRIPLTQSDKEQFLGVNIMLVIDLSSSMKAVDILPNRLRRAKIEVHELLEKARDHRIGITVFSARPHLFVPLTYDHAALSEYLDSLTKLKFPTVGSDVFAAIKLAQQELIKEKGKSAIILVTDGDFPNLTNSQLEILKLTNIPLYTLGIGTVEGEAIQIEDGTWLEYKQQQVISRMNEDNLQRLSAYLNGKYSPVYDDNSDWKLLYEQGVATHNSLSNINNGQRVLWRELFPYLLVPSLLLFLFALNIYHLKLFNKMALFLMLVLISVPDKNSYALELEFGQTMEQAAYRAYKKGRYADSEKLYQRMSGYRSYIGQGNSLYKMGHYKKAIQQFVLATLNAKNNTQRVSALYNLANSYFRVGSFTEAIATYKDVLRYQPDNKASLYNVEISRLLKTSIENHLAAEDIIISSEQQGDGPKSARISDGAEVRENTSVSIGDSKNKFYDIISLPEIPNLSDDKVKQLLLLGFENIKFANKNHTANKLRQYRNLENINLFKTQQQANRIEDSQYLLWNRLFEMEEGFPAPVEKPHIIPGVKPW